MTALILGVTIGAALALLLAGLVLVRHPRHHQPRTRTLRVTSRARSADEALVRVTVEAEISLGVGSTASTARTVADEIETGVRTCLATRRLLALPGVGDHLSLAVETPHVTVHQIAVTAADVEVTRELRRLVGGP